MEVKQETLIKWEFLIEAAKRYWIDSMPTGMEDKDFDRLELQAAREDDFFVRDYVLRKYLKGKKTQNKYIEKIKKFKVENGTMLDAIIKTANELGIGMDDLYCNLKYDGSSIAIYLDPENGKPVRIVTVGNTNLDNLGVDQTWKLNRLIPSNFPRGIVAIQCEALIDLNRAIGIDPDHARQKANGLINSKYCEAEVESLLTLRAYRYYLAPGTVFPGKSYKDILMEFPTKTNSLDGHVTFAPAQTWTLRELVANTPQGFTETDRTQTNTGLFLNDGWVLYNRDGICQRALKFAGAGSGTEAIKTIVRSIQWNDQSVKGKDSWSANVIVDPVVLRGSTIRKPSAGSVAKLIKNGISAGAEVGIILANSTIPMVGDVFKAGNGDYQWPTCRCGYTMGPDDVYGSNLKCGNPMCTARIERMTNYLENYGLGSAEDLNGLLVIDRFNWENTNVDISVLLTMPNEEAFYEYLSSFLKTSLQKRNLALVWKAAWTAIGIWKQKNNT